MSKVSIVLQRYTETYYSPHREEWREVTELVDVYQDPANAEKRAAELNSAETKPGPDYKAWVSIREVK